MWWPNPEDLKDLTIEEEDRKIIFTAPEGSKCSEWLSYYSSSEDLEKEFKAAIMKAIDLFLKEDP